MTIEITHREKIKELIAAAVRIEAAEGIRACDMIDWRKLHQGMAEIFGPLPELTWRDRLRCNLDRVRDAWLVLTGRRDVE